MLIRRCLLGCSFSILAGFMFAQNQDAISPGRDRQSLEILARVVQANGGSQAFANVRDITERGEITFDWGDHVSGPLTIQILGGSFRLEADLPDDKRVWVARNGTGSETKNHKSITMTQQEAVNLGNLTFPLAHVVSALLDPAAQVAFVGIEKMEGRSVYRLEVKGQLGLATKEQCGPVSKDLLIDALTFSIVGLEDHPHPTNRVPNAKSIDTTPREVAFSDFRTVNGLLVPFSITTKVHGQEMFQIHLSEVLFNSTIDDAKFRP